jgi:hypothetical protein
VPGEERADYVKPEFLKKAAALDPVDWLPRMQAQKFRLQDAIFESNTPKAAKEKLRAVVPTGATIAIYKTPEDFNAVVRGKTELQWIRSELRALSAPDASSSTVEARSARSR